LTQAKKTRPRPAMTKVWPSTMRKSQVRQNNRWVQNSRAISKMFCHMLDYSYHQGSH